MVASTVTEVAEHLVSFMYVMYKVYKKLECGKSKEIAKTLKR